MRELNVARFIRCVTKVTQLLILCPLKILSVLDNHKNIKLL